MALRYVGRYATSRAKLLTYLRRKLRERGWDGDREPDLQALAAQFCELGYIDDAAYALSKSRSLSSRGYGRRRLDQTLHLAGIGQEEGAAARDHADGQAVEAALLYAQRRKIGPFGTPAADRKEREKAIVEWPSDIAVDVQEIADRAGLDLS
jgi:regulatory protein